jgi:hypothetical protein
MVQVTAKTQKAATVAGYAIWLPMFIVILPCAWIWAMFTDFTAGHFMWMAFDLIVVPLGVLRGFGFCCRWW